MPIDEYILLFDEVANILAVRAVQLAVDETGYMFTTAVEQVFHGKDDI